MLMSISPITLDKVLVQLNSEVNNLQEQLKDIASITNEFLHELSSDNLPEDIHSLLEDDEIKFMLSFINKHQFQIIIHKHYIELYIFSYDKDNHVSTDIIKYVISSTDNVNLLVSEYEYVNDTLTNSLKKDLQRANINLDYIKEHRNIYIGTVVSIAEQINSILHFNERELAFLKSLKLSHEIISSIKKLSIHNLYMY